jgi:hypothetical protein
VRFPPRNFVPIKKKRKKEREDKVLGVDFKATLDNIASWWPV